MQPPQLALAQRLLDLALAECLRRPAATLGAVHLKGVLLDELLAGGCAVLEPSGKPREGRLLRLADDVVRVERLALPVRQPPAGGRPARAPDLRLWSPERLDVELHARGGFAVPGREPPRALADRVARLTSRVTDLLLLACDRRSYDALRRPPGRAAAAPSAAGASARGNGAASAAAEADTPAALAAFCAAVLPASAALGAAFEEHEADVGGGRVYVTRAAVTPMVFGVQRVVAAVHLRAAGRRAAPAAALPAQLDAFERA